MLLQQCQALLSIDLEIAADEPSEYLKAQPTTPTAWSVLTSCPYIEMLAEGWRPKPDDTGALVFTVPLGNGAATMIHLEDLGHYARWIFDNASESTGLNLEVATAHVSLDDLVTATQKVTGRTAKAIRKTPEKYYANDPQVKLAYGTDGKDSTLLSVSENLTGFFHVWRDGWRRGTTSCWTGFYRHE